MSDQDVRDALQRLTDRVGTVETELRVVKHDLKNMEATSQGLGSKLERVEERMSTEIKALTKTMGDKFDVLGEKIVGLNIKQERGLGFFAGIGFVFASCGAVLIAFTKLVFGAG